MVNCKFTSCNKLKYIRLIQRMSGKGISYPQNLCPNDPADVQVPQPW
jgi:hypothetical protein